MMLFIAFFASCYYDKEDFLYATHSASGTCDTTNVTYSATIKPITDANCKGCHSSGNFVCTDWASINTYLNANSAKLLNNINYTGTFNMPPSGKLNSCYINQINIWINAGHLNN